MSKFWLRVALAAAMAVLVIGMVMRDSRNSVVASERVTALPTPAVDESLASSPGQETAVVAGGCFWGIQAVFQHVKGVISATSGYSGGSAKTAEYEIVSTGTTNHAESVKIVFDPSKITYGQLLQVFLSVAHDPTQLNHQYPDEGTQYRSVIFYSNDEQKKIADDYIAQLEAFYPAEGYHQNYAALHPDNPYIAHFDLPKVANLQQIYPQLYRNQ